jgi:hypothetical protein
VVEAGRGSRGERDDDVPRRALAGRHDVDLRVEVPLAAVEGEQIVSHLRKPRGRRLLAGGQGRGPHDLAEVEARVPLPGDPPDERSQSQVIA